ncbi:CLUMA_CG020731, isoform A [Clunio marinus]|uniref:CLUMA_CG020731, isoform A n=1 Tax=Clunio marinus TaxID=568069 RepID=A0A1J1J9T2_9DIPT|nr:CLUMA_CG020731, isoform A [Clunio marinus]
MWVNKIVCFSILSGFILVAVGGTSIDHGNINDIDEEMSDDLPELKRVARQCGGFGPLGMILGEAGRNINITQILGVIRQVMRILNTIQQNNNNNGNNNNNNDVSP